MTRNAGKIHGRSLRAALVGGLALVATAGAANADVIVVTLDDTFEERTNLGAASFRGQTEPFVPDLTISDHTVNERWLPDPPGEPDPQIDADGTQRARERARGTALDGFTAPSGGVPAPAVPPAGGQDLIPLPFAPGADPSGGFGGITSPFAPGQQPPVPAPGVLPILGLLALASRRRRRLQERAARGAS